MDYRLFEPRYARHALSAPFIYAPMITLVALDLFLEIYHRIAFPLYGLPCVNRSEFIKIDRQKLSYLTWYDKINCMYCGYANGFLHYASEIAGRTEQYWCGIKHQEGTAFKNLPHHKDFLEYGNKENFEKKYPPK
jgi:hypothetical protein